MHTGKLVFAQLMDYLPLHTFRRCVAKYPGCYPTLTFSHLDQFLCMAFAQLTCREACARIPPSSTIWAYGAALPGAHWRMPREPRLAHLPGFRPQLDPDGPQALCRGQLRLGIGTYSLCARFDHHRPVPGTVSVGALSQTQRCSQAPYVTRFAGQHSGFYPYLRRQAPRCQHSRPDCFRGWQLLRHGPGLYRLRPAPCPAHVPSFLCHARQSQPTIPANPFAPSRQGNRPTLRPNHQADWDGGQPGLSDPVATGEVLRCQERQIAGLSYQQLRSSSPDYRRALSLPLAGGAVLQSCPEQGRRMDQAASADQGVFWNFRCAVKTQVWIAIAVYVLVAILKKRLESETSLYTILQILSLTLFEKKPLKQFGYKYSIQYRGTENS